MNATQTPVKTKASAPVTGANGGGLAAKIIKDAEAKGQADLKAEKPMKARLFDLIKLNGDDHVAFRASLQKYLDGVEADAKKVGLTVTQHREANAVVNSICSTLSMWRKFSRAISAGFKPEFDPKTGHMPQTWAMISRLASEHLDTAKAKAEQDKLVAERNKIEADTGMDPIVKQGELQRINLAMEGKAVKVGSTSKRGRKPLEFTVELERFFENRPLQQLEQAHTWLGDLIGLMKTAEASPIHTPAMVAKQGAPEPKVEVPAPAARKGKRVRMVEEAVTE